MLNRLLFGGLVVKKRSAVTLIPRVLILSLLVTSLASPILAQEPISTELKRKATPAPKVDERPLYAPDEIVVRYEDGLDPLHSGVQALESRFGLVPIKFNESIQYHRYRLPESMSVSDAILLLRGDSLVDYVEANYIYYLDAIPNDSFYDNYQSVATDLAKWYFDGIGADRNLNAESAWDVTTGRTDVTIAIVDSGIDLDHPDLAANIWTNPGEVAGNGSDDDGNGFVDDVNGWDFQSNDNNPNPDLGNGIDDDGVGGPDSNTFHGTFSASCAGAVGNNATGATGAAWNCKLMAVKIFTDDGGAFTTDIADGISYAAANGADVINMSFGGGFSSTVQNAVNFAHGQGSVQVASAGNGNSSSQQYPSSLNFVISVGANDSGSVLAGGSGDLDGRASFSQYGTAAVDVVAPGTDLVGAAVLSVAEGNPGAPSYFLSSGTSFSGPTVAGLCALVISKGLDVGAGLTNDDVENIIQNTANDLPDDPGDSPNGGSSWDNHGRVDFQAALDAVSGGPPVNTPPVADAGPDQGGLVGQNISFDGSGSSDADNDPLTYSWDFGDNSPDGSGVSVNHSYATAGTYVVTLTVDDGQDTDMDTAVVTIDDVPPPSGTLMYFSSLGNRSYPGLSGTMANEDIILYDSGSGAFTQYFDGSDVGLGSAVMDGFVLLADGSILISLSASFSVPGVGTADDSDVVQFAPTSLGPTTAGVFTLFFDGSDVGLTSNGEDVDALSVNNGNLVVSTTGGFSGSGASGADEDFFEFVGSFGSSTSGSFTRLFDGSDVGLGGNGSHDMRALHISLVDGRFYVSTVGNFNFGGISGADEDIARFTPSTLGNSTSGAWDLYLDFSTVGMQTGGDVTGLFLIE